MARPESGEVLEIVNDVLQRCRQGHQGAWRELFNSNFSFVYGVARRLGTPVSELDDVCQEAFEVVYKKLDSFQSGTFTTWLYRITANVVSGRHRRRRSHRSLADRAARQPSKESSTPEQDFQKREAERMVGEVLTAMKPKKREVFALYELEGLDGQEIAERVGCKIDTVWARLHHAKEFARIAKKRGFTSGDVP